MYGWLDCPAAVREQIAHLSNACARILAERLAGIYLHGSLAMGCFNPHRSDLDLLVVMTERLSSPTQRQLIELLLSCSQQPFPIEISFLAREQLRPWRYPTPFDLHYSETWRATYTRTLSAETWPMWNTHEHHDSDLAAHITVLHARGVCLMGEPIAAIFPAVPADDFRDSIADDISASLASIATDPVYAVLNCCRTYAYLRDKHIFSKAEGGRWALQALPVDFHPLVAAALASYTSATSDQHFPPIALDAFANVMRQLLAPLLQHRTTT